MYTSGANESIGSTHFILRIYNYTRIMVQASVQDLIWWAFYVDVFSTHRERTVDKGGK